jgi:ketosteroid isomerase-like protein
MVQPRSDRQQISAVIEQYRQAFASMDIDLLRGLWDQDHDNLVYVASERPAAITDWEGISQYYEQLPEGLPPDPSISMRVHEQSTDLLGDVACAFCTFRYEGPVVGRDEPFVANGRVTFVLQRRFDSWKVIHYHESSPPRSSSAVSTMTRIG